MIKKTSETTPTIAQVVNTQSNSTTDTYSCDYSNKHLGGVTLYNNASGTNSDFALSESVANFKKIEINYSTNDGNQGVKAVLNDNANFNTEIFELWTSSATGDVIYAKMAQLLFSGTSVTYTNGYESVIGSNFSRNTSSNIKIHKVVGYK